MEADHSPASQLIADRYPSEFIEALGQRYEFDPEATNLRHFLARGVGRYVRYSEAVPHRRAADKEMRLRIRKALDLLDQLADTLDSDALESDILDAEDVVRIIRPEAEVSSDRPMGLLLFDIPFTQRSLRALRAHLRRRLRNVGDKGGRPRNVALRMYVTAMGDFWAQRLNRPFTVDYHQGAGLTPAFRFVRDVLSPIDQPEDRAIVTAMRDYIRTYGTHKNP